MADENEAKVDEDEALLAPIRERVRKTQPDAEFQLLRSDPRVGPVVLRSPTEAEFHLWQNMLEDETQKRVATRNLFMTLCVHPPMVGAFLTKLPGFVASKPVNDALKYLTGMSAQSVGKG